MVNESGNPTEKLTEKEKLKKRFPDFSDEEVQERLETTKLLKEGKITDDEYAEKIDTL
ncbi:MAG: hypothetical protein LBP53_01095 [Candidatus Peribacteria bacterium]|jgi:hypothetical protein|nr:hypothetical protein [Candidatus Peribacteria bacterium]